MKSLRKSLNSNRESSSRPQISTPLPLPNVSKPPSAILPPQKVIRALSSYKSQAPQELSFTKGDFFYVLKDIEVAGDWYEAHNPVTGARGLVPRSMFEEFGKNATSNRASQPASRAQSSLASPVSPTQSQGSAPKPAAFYAIVLHDFMAERPDELDAKRGDAIAIVAQSNREWFVAKPIGRLGRPGLIPVSFVEIHDPATGKPIPDIEGLMDRGELPKVEEWKRTMINYKQNSIPLGIIDPPTATNATPTPTQPIPPPQETAEPPSPDPLPEGILLSADVVSFHYEMNEYWFRINATFQPYGRPGSSLPPSKQLILFRVYNDFYDFQVALLETFPREAGRQPPEPRTLPYMPGPAQNVDHALTATRRSELDEYIRSLCALSHTGGRYILEHVIVRKFLALKPGDVENDGDPCVREIQALDDSDNSDDIYGNDDYPVQDQMAQMNFQDGAHSDGSDYEDNRYDRSSKTSTGDRHPYHQGGHNYEDNLKPQSYAQSHQRAGSSSSFNQNNARSHSPHYRENNYSPQPHNGHHPSQSQSSSRWHDSGYQSNHVSTPSTDSSFRTSQMVPRSRSQSTATTNINTPPISAANPQTAFVKIKIFDRVADDLIAIRVHPKVTHTELMDKVQARLGGEVAKLRYRDSMTNTFVGLDNNDELRAWMDGTDKHVLYAD
ncbi:hypothetical protein CVT24_001976 [Panaeolus cyanescens]|uniref:Scd2/ral3 n=1 Tax=Panaeolus cyanescens TaxID=181874 RepID=A0A409YHE9_9AGAR|nr:hypothetical protein CVT24_001976 [Panaeolus cyanescens]